jgi:hypothetical protein
MKYIKTIVIILIICLTILILINSVNIHPNSKNNYTQLGNIDYSNPDNWYLINSSQENTRDLFVIYPTMVFNNSKTLFVDINDTEMAEGVKDFNDIIALENFSKLGFNIYIPKYEQLNLDKLNYNSNITTNELIYNGKAYKDIMDAFNYYMTNYNNGKEYVILSHSQGSILNYFLMKDYMSNYMNETQRKKLLIDYCIGIPITKDLQKNLTIKPSQKPNDLHSYVSWNTATQSEINKLTKRITWGDGSEVVVNPITFEISNKYVPAEKNGISILKYFNNPMKINNNLTGAQVVTTKSGAKVVKIDVDEHEFLNDTQIQDQDDYNLGYTHHWDISLYIGSIINNLQLRINESNLRKNSSNFKFPSFR